MNREETIERLKEAQELPHATLEDLRNVPKGITNEKLSEYLTAFLKPQETCWLCEKSLVVDWGLVHGMANCVECGMDVKMYHFPENDDGEKIRFERGLQYHPNNYSTE